MFWRFIEKLRVFFGFAPKKVDDEQTETSRGNIVERN